MKNSETIGNCLERAEAEVRRVGGKILNLRLLQKGGFDIPETFLPEDIPSLPVHMSYIVRSSDPLEDSRLRTSAGLHESVRAVKREDLLNAVEAVRRQYENGNVAIQPDLTDEMDFSGVAYTNLKGETVIPMGIKNAVHSIVEGTEAETTIIISNGQYSIKGKMVGPTVSTEIGNEVMRVEDYFGIPIDVEFAFIDGGVVMLQTRPLLSPTDEALKEHERRQLKKLMAGRNKELGLEEIVLGVGNSREILGNNEATMLSTTTFNYIFSGDGEKILGAVQLGRNELGYDIGTEIFPWVTMVGGKVYFNFTGDALQFRPKGITQEDLTRIVNGVYLPMARADPDILNYPELRLYVQFPEQAEQVGLNPEPFRVLVDKNRKAMEEIVMPEEPPKKRIAGPYNDIMDCLAEIKRTVEDIRVNSAMEYVKAARLAFFALEDVRVGLEKLREEERGVFDELSSMHGRKTPDELRDLIIYDESIGSFEVLETEDFRYLGSFELSLPRGFPPQRHFKKGQEIPHLSIAKLVENTRRILAYREKIKFTLFRDYDYLGQLYGQFGELSGLNEDIYHLDFSELSLLLDEPTLALYRVGLRKLIKGKDLFENPIFGSDLTNGNTKRYENHPKLIFGSLPKKGVDVIIGKNGYLVDSIDQTVGIPEGTEVVFVPYNIRPGSHFFTIQSDSGLPVIALPEDDLDDIISHAASLDYTIDHTVRVVPKEGYVSVQTSSKRK